MRRIVFATDNHNPGGFMHCYINLKLNDTNLITSLIQQGLTKPQALSVLRQVRFGQNNVEAFEAKRKLLALQRLAVLRHNVALA